MEELCGIEVSDARSFAWCAPGGGVPREGAGAGDGIGDGGAGGEVGASTSS